jgi:hypothetical protein
MNLMDKSAEARPIPTRGFPFHNSAWIMPSSGAAAKVLLRFIEEGFCNERMS